MKVNREYSRGQKRRPYTALVSGGRALRYSLLAVAMALPVALPVISKVSAAVEEPAANEKEGEQLDVATLVGQLGDDSYLVREKATETLWKLGKAALPELKKAVAGNDPEASERAKELVMYISAGILFDSPEEIKALVLKFSRSNVENKLAILRKLMEMGQWKQVLHLAKFEEQEDVRKQMSDIVMKAAGQATRTAIAEGNYDLAEEILEMGPNDVDSMLMRAWFYRCRGQLEQRLKEAADMPGKKGALWRMSLHRVSGDIRGAIREAEKAGEHKLADAMRVIMGNPVPWLKRFNKQGQLDMIYSMGCRIQLDRIHGKEKQAALIAREMARMARDEDSTSRVINSLAANGFRKEAIDLLSRHDVATAFDYFDSIESPERCLEVMGIPKGAKPPFTGWVKEFTREAVEDEDEEMYDRLIQLAHFLTTHGEREHAVAVLTPMMTALEEDGSDDWFELIASMSIYNLGAEAIHFIKERGNEDGEVELGVKRLLRQIPSKARSHIWELLKKRNNQDIGKALQELGVLSGMLADPNNDAEKLSKALMDEVADKDVDEKVDRIGALFSFAAKSNDLILASRLADQLTKLNERWKVSKVYLDNGLGRWQQLEEHYGELVKESPGDHQNLINYYITLRKLGRNDEAKKVFHKIEFLSIGAASRLHLLGWKLYEEGYDKEALDVWLQASLLSDVSRTDFDRSIVYLANYGKDLFQRGQWQQARSIAEVACQTMMRGRRSSSSVHLVLRQRFYADFCAGMELLESGKKAEALKKLDQARQLIPGDGSLADEFFPVLRTAGIGKHYERWFEDSYRHVNAACEMYPKAHNSRNTAAWLAARAVRRLDEAEAHASAAVKERSTQGAYLDTMAEVWFAKGDRAKAVAWSEKAVAGSVSHAHGAPRRESLVITNYKQLHKQLQRFKDEPMPVAKP